MTRSIAVVLVLATAAIAGPSLVLVDGRTVAILRVVESGPERTRVQVAGDDGPRDWVLPTKSVVTIRFDRPSPRPGKLFNLYLRNGDAVHGTVTGDGNSFRLEAKSISGLKVALEDGSEVAAKRFEVDPAPDYVDVKLEDLPY